MTWSRRYVDAMWTLPTVPICTPLQFLSQRAIDPNPPRPASQLGCACPFTTHSVCIKSTRKARRREGDKCVLALGFRGGRNFRAGGVGRLRFSARPGVGAVIVCVEPSTPDAASSYRHPARPRESAGQPVHTLARRVLVSARSAAVTWLPLITVVVSEVMLAVLGEGFSPGFPVLIGERCRQKSPPSGGLWIRCAS